MPRSVREQLILDVAGRVFARAGYHAGSMEEIAALADVSKPMLYAYFGSKEGLYVAYIDRTGRQLLERLVGAADPSQPPRLRLRRRIEEFLAFVDEHQDGWKVLFREMAASGPLVREVAALRTRIVEAVGDMLHSLLSGAHADAIAHAIVGAGESLANWWLEHPEVSRSDLADWYDGMVQAIVWAAIRRGS